MTPGRARAICILLLVLGSACEAKYTASTAGLMRTRSGDVILLVHGCGSQKIGVVEFVAGNKRTRYVTTGRFSTVLNLSRPPSSVKVTGDGPGILSENSVELTTLDTPDGRSAASNELIFDGGLLKVETVYTGRASVDATYTHGPPIYLTKAEFDRHCAPDRHLDGPNSDAHRANVDLHDPTGRQPSPSTLGMCVRSTVRHGVSLAESSPTSANRGD